MQTAPGNGTTRVYLNDEDHRLLEQAPCRFRSVKPFFSPCFERGDQAYRSKKEARVAKDKVLEQVQTAKALCARCPAAQLCRQITQATKATGISDGEYFVKGRPAVVPGESDYLDRQRKLQRRRGSLRAA